MSTQLIVNNLGLIIGLTSSVTTEMSDCIVIKKPINFSADTFFEWVLTDGVWVRDTARTLPSVTGTPLIPVVLTAIPGVELDYDDTDNNYTVLENATYLATGTCAIPVQTFRVPFVRTDTGRKIYMKAVIAADSSFVLHLNFPTKGEWYTDSAQLNSDLPKAIFSLEKQVFKVM